MQKKAAQGKALNREAGVKVIFAALNILKDSGGSLTRQEIMQKIPEKVQLSPWDCGVYEKSGNVRWKAILHLYSIICVKAGFLVKQNGIWHLTADGEKALRLGEEGFFLAAREGYGQWRKDRLALDVVSTEDADTNGSSELVMDEVEQRARQGLHQHIASKNPYEFQDIVAALLRAMGYYTPFVAPRGKDGGVDVLAYRDPLGTIHPRIKVQVKHRPDNPVSVQEVRQLLGVLQKDGDVGMVVSTGGFTPDARATAQNSHVHIELVDFDRLLSLWQEFYPRLSDEDKSRLPLKPIYFLAPRE